MFGQDHACFSSMASGHCLSPTHLKGQSEVMSSYTSWVTWKLLKIVDLFVIS